jgi:hypothetical protein
MNRLIRGSRVIAVLVAGPVAVLAAGLGGCMHMHRQPTTVATTMATTAPVGNESVATGDLGTVQKVPGVTPKPKPFIAIPGITTPVNPAPAVTSNQTPIGPTASNSNARPSTLLLEHASPDSPVPLSAYGKQPVHELSDFDLHKGLTAASVQQRVGAPAQLADTADPWFVYRLTGSRELWLHFAGVADPVLDAADVVRAAEDGYVRDRVYSAE